MPGLQFGQAASERAMPSIHPAFGDFCRLAAATHQADNISWVCTYGTGLPNGQPIR